jgi:hypothetical protein
MVKPNLLVMGVNVPASKIDNRSSNSGTISSMVGCATIVGPLPIQVPVMFPGCPATGESACRLTLMTRLNVIIILAAIAAALTAMVVGIFWSALL